MSMMATSGAVESIRLSDWITSPASPQISMSGWRAIWTRSPSLTSGWSSTISTRAGRSPGFSVWLDMVAISVQRAHDCHAPILQPRNVERPSDRLGAVLHDLESHSLTGWRLVVQSDTVVPGFQPEGPVLLRE